MNNFGALPFGEIPEPLKYTRPFQLTTLSNGIRVCTEKTSNHTASVGCFVKAGSRNETIETSGSAYLTEKMFLSGTSSRSKSDLCEDIESMGARYNAETGREISNFSMRVMPGDVGRAVDLLGDMICNSQFNGSELELAKESVSQEHEANHRRYKETTMENVHFNVYREHMMGQPTKGDRDNVQNLTVDHLRDFHTTNFFGDNMVIVAVGNVNHDEFVERVERSFTAMPKQATSVVSGKERPIYIPAMLMIRDDEMVNSNVGVFYDAPSATHPDYYAFQLMKSMMGNYRIDKNCEHLNDIRKQYNGMHTIVGDQVDVTMADCEYMAYSDCGIIGNWFYGNEVFTRQMNYCGVVIPTQWSQFMADVEVQRGKAAIFNKLLNEHNPDDTMKKIGRQIHYMNRRVPRSEVAKRIAHLDNYHIKHLANEWFYDAEPSWTNWGPIEGVSSIGSYKYFKINTMSTVTNTHHTLFT
jgi:processing peptidase subunit beta